MSSKKKGQGPAAGAAGSAPAAQTPPATPSTIPEAQPTPPEQAPEPATPPLEAVTPGIVNVDASTPSEQRAAALQALLAGEQPDPADQVAAARADVTATGTTYTWDPDGKPHIVQCAYYRLRRDGHTVKARRGDTILLDPGNERVAWAVTEGYLKPLND